MLFSFSRSKLWFISSTCWCGLGATSSTHVNAGTPALYNRYTIPTTTNHFSAYGNDATCSLWTWDSQRTPESAASSSTVSTSG